MAVEYPDVPLPSITDLQAYIWGDSKFIGSVPYFTLGQALEMIQRDKFGILINHHFYPLTSIPNSLEEFDITLLALADQLRKNCILLILPRNLSRISESLIMI